MQRTNIVSGFWSKRYRDCAMTLTLSIATLTGCGLLAGCEIFQPQREVMASPESGEQTVALTPSKAETAVKNATDYANNVLVPIGNAADPVTGGTSGVIALGIVNLLSLIGNVMQNIRINKQHKVITTIQRDTDTGIVPMLKTADESTVKFAKKIVGEA